MREFVILLVVCILIGGVGAVYGLEEPQFTIADFWQEGGRITYENYFNLDLSGTFFDLESSSQGYYSLQGNTTEGNLEFFNSVTFEEDDVILVEAGGDLGPSSYYSYYGDFVSNDKIGYDFSVTDGVVDFYVFDDDQYEIWDGGGSVTAIKIILDSSGASGTVLIPSSDVYYFVWYYRGSSTVFLDFKLTKKKLKSLTETIEIDPIELRDKEGKQVTLFGMDTSKWDIDSSVLLEIDEKDVYFSIIREEDLTITYDGNSTVIPCWVLEKKNFEEIYIEEVNFIMRGDYSIWKSKYSGVALKKIYDGKIYDSGETLLGTVYDKYTVESTRDVLLIPPSIAFTSFSISDALLFPFITFIILVLLKKYKPRRRET